MADIFSKRFNIEVGISNPIEFASFKSWVKAEIAVFKVLPNVFFPCLARFKAYIGLGAPGGAVTAAGSAIFEIKAVISSGIESTESLNIL